MSEMPHFWCFFAAGLWEKDTENRAAETSLRSFLFRDNFRIPIGKKLLRFRNMQEKLIKLTTHKENGINQSLAAAAVCFVCFLKVEAYICV